MRSYKHRPVASGSYSAKNYQIVTVALFQLAAENKKPQNSLSVKVNLRAHKQKQARQW